MENLVIKDNLIKERGLFGRTKYVIRNGEIREPGLFGRTVYVIVGNEIKEPGRKGETVYIIDGDTIKKPDVIKRTLFGKTVVKPKKENSVGVYEKHSKGVDYGNKSTVGISWVEPKDEIKKLGSHTYNGIVYHTIQKIENGYAFTQDIPEYNEVLVFYTFLNKYPIIKRPELIEKNEYSRWTFSKIGIEDVNTLHKKLLSQGFYAPATNEEILSTYSIGDIKNVISKLGLNIKGKKQDLIKGLIDQVDEKTLSINLFNGYTSISSKGKDWMAVHELEFSWYNATEEHASLEEFKKHQAQKNDKQGNIEKLQADIAKDKETFGRYIYDELISIYKEDEKNQDILVCLLKELLIDLSGSYDYLTWKKLGFDKDIMGKPFQIIFTPYLVKTLPKYKNDFVVSILDRVYEIELPVNVCDKIIFNEIITRIFEGALSVEEQKKYIKKLNSKLLEKI